ncbi:MAG TPA: IS110 family transposase [Acidimicrobiales bacterium]|nr:IS110 family transposase [Acidimicrobiales bacterium]
MVSTPSDTVAVAIDVGKNEFAFSAKTSARDVLVKPQLHRPMTASGLAAAVSVLQARIDPTASVKVGIEAAGHYHLPLLVAARWPTSWELLELNPGHVTELRRVLGKRSVKNDATDLEAMTELLLSGQGTAVGVLSDALEQLRAWAGQRRARVEAASMLHNQLLTHLDRSFPGLTLAIKDVLGTKVGRLVAAEFADPARLAALGEARFIRFASTRGLMVQKRVAARLVAAAHDALPTLQASAHREVLAGDLALLHQLEEQTNTAEVAMERLLPSTPFEILQSVPGWAVVRAGTYGAALGDPTRFTNYRQVYRSAGLNPILYESAGKRRGELQISREGSVALRTALVDMGRGLWLNDPSAKAYAATLRARGKKGKVIGCAMAHRANRIAFALVRDQTPYKPECWRTSD